MCVRVRGRSLSGNGCKQLEFDRPFANAKVGGLSLNAILSPSPRSGFFLHVPLYFSFSLSFSSSCPFLFCPPHAKSSKAVGSSAAYAKIFLDQRSQDCTTVCARDGKAKGKTRQILSLERRLLLLHFLSRPISLLLQRPLYTSLWLCHYETSPACTHIA